MVKTQESEARRRVCFKTTDALSLGSPTCEGSGRQFEVTSQPNTWMPTQRQFYFVFLIVSRDSEMLCSFSRASQLVNMHSEACCDTRINAFLILRGRRVQNALLYSCAQLFGSILMPGTECAIQWMQLLGSLIGISTLPSGMAAWGQLFNEEQLKALCVIYSIVWELSLNFLDVSPGT